MELVDVSLCTGCGACMQICQKGAIVFEEDSEGFPSPRIVAEKCVDCGACTKVCPALTFPETHPIQSAYAVQLLDHEALRESTSGGVFTALSREIFRRNGVVYGCVWDKRQNAVIRRAENEDDIKPMRGSKYVWSWAGDMFPMVKQDLRAGREVLFVGLPCQVAGLKKYLRKPYEKLYLVDFFCGGAPSPRAFQTYLKTLTRDVPFEKLDFKFRDKEKYGVGVHISFQGNQGRVHQSYVKNSYFFSYHTKVCHRPSCYQCQYRYENRVEDMTIGDYWGVGNYHPEFDIRAGVSALLINTDKGAALLDAVKEQLQISPAQVEEIASENNLTLGNKKQTFRPPEFRRQFFAVLQSEGWNAAERKYLCNKTRLKLWLKLKLPAKYIKTIKKILK